jgi:hypothetical protein
MRRKSTSTLLTVMLAVAGAGSPAVAQSSAPAAEAPTARPPSASGAGNAPVGITPSVGPAVDAPKAIDGAWVERHALEIQLAQLNADLERTRQQVAAGMAPASALASLENQQASVLARIAGMNGDLAQQQRMAGLRRPVVVQLRDASVKQAAQALSQASGVPIGVDDRVPADLRLTMDVQGVPLITVLEAIGRQTNLMIAADPQSAKGFVLKPWPFMEIKSGTPGAGLPGADSSPSPKQVFAGPYAPWSDELGPLVGAWSNSLPGVLWRSSAKLLGSAPAAEGTGLLTRLSPYAPRLQESPNLFDGKQLPWVAGSTGWVGARTGPLALTAVGDRMVVTAQPGTGPQGEPGVWLTVYRLEGNQLRKVGSTFDRAETNAARAGSRSTVPARNSIDLAPVPVPAAEAKP